jgi:hypothetical protein
MAVHASDLAFGDLIGNDCPAVRALDHLVDRGPLLLSLYMIEFQHKWILLTAVNARMVCQIPPHPLFERSATLAIVDSAFRDIDRSIPFVMRSAVFGDALLEAPMSPPSR